MINTCKNCNETKELFSCKCDKLLCTSCINSHQSCGNDTLVLYDNEYTNTLAEQLKKELDRILLEIENYRSSLSESYLNSDIFANVELPKKFFLNIDFDSHELQTCVLSTKNSCLIIYNILKNEDSVIDLPKGDIGLGSSLCSNLKTVFVIGGLIEFSPVNQIVCIDKSNPNNKTYLKLKIKRYFCGSICFGQFLFVIGGMDSENNALDSIEYFDLETGKSGELKMNKPREKPSVIRINSKIFIAGSDSGVFVDVLNVEKFRMKEKEISWAEGKIFMIGSYCGEIVVIDEVGAKQERSDVVLRFDDGVRNMWSQQSLVGLEGYLHFVDYYSGEIIRIYVADFRRYD